MMRLRAEHGFALLLAIVIITFLAIAAATMVRAFNYSSGGAVFAAQHARALAAARSGIYWAAYRAINFGDCGSFSFTLDDVAQTSFQITGNCTAGSHRILTTDVNIYDIDVTATIGSFGNPEFISRRLRAKYFDD